MQRVNVCIDVCNMYKRVYERTYKRMYEQHFNVCRMHERRMYEVRAGLDSNQLSWLRQQLTELA